MRTKGQTSIHLLLASIVTLFGVMLILITLAMSWEAWMVPIIVIGNSLVWILHIGRVGSETFYENLCAGLLMIGFFFFGVHDIVLYDIPAVACMLLLIFSMFNKKRLLYMTAGLYLLELTYHFFSPAYHHARYGSKKHDPSRFWCLSRDRRRHHRYLSDQQKA